MPPIQTENCQQAYDQDPNKVEVTPHGMWPVAVAATVRYQGDRRLPIVRILMCPATITIYKQEFPSGVILCNDSPPPNNMRMYEFRTVKGTANSEEVTLTNNAGWPWCNKVLLW